MATNLTINESINNVNISGISETTPSYTTITLSNDQGPQGVQGLKGDTGPASTVPGPAGPGIATGGTAGQALVKIDSTNYNTQWATISSSASGSAGGDLTGTYPNPTLASAGTAGTYTKVTTDSKGRVTSGTTLSSTDIPNITPSQVTGTAVITTDGRLSDARTPTAHASTHASAGSDPITILPVQVTGLASSATTDTTDASNITSGTLPNARLASIPDSALAQITTANKVNTSAITGTLGVGNGGTGATTFTSGNALIGNGTSAITSVGVTTTGENSKIVKTGTTGNITAGVGGVTSGGAVVVTADAATTVPLTINAPVGSSQSANFLTINSPTDFSNNLVTIDAGGWINLAFGGISAGNNTISAQALSAGNQGISSTGTVYHSYQTVTSATGLNLFPATSNGKNITRLTPTGSFTITAGPPPAGAMCCLIILTSGTTSRTITFGTNFKTGTSTLATGTVSGKYFVINYVSDGTALIEISRTAAL